MTERDTKPEDAAVGERIDVHFEHPSAIPAPTPTDLLRDGANQPVRDRPGRTAADAAARLAARRQAEQEAAAAAKKPAAQPAAELLPLVATGRATCGCAGCLSTERRHGRGQEIRTLREGAPRSCVADAITAHLLAELRAGKGAAT